MLRKILFASLITFGAAGAATAQGLPQNGPYLIGGGNNAKVEYGGAPPGVVVGGGIVALNGGGENRSYSYGAVNALPGQLGMLVRGGENAQVVYQPVTPATGIAHADHNAFRG